MRSEISELEAMRHPRRNEVYRDVGSEPHAPDDPDFVDLHEIPFEPDAALLLCSDGLSDLVDSTSMLRTVVGSAPAIRARWFAALIDAANACRRQGQRHGRVRRRRATSARSAARTHATAESTAVLADQHVRGTASIGLVSLIIAGARDAGFVVYRSGHGAAAGSSCRRRRRLARAQQTSGCPARTNRSARRSSVRGRAREIIVEPGEYRERITLTRQRPSGQPRAPRGDDSAAGHRLRYASPNRPWSPPGRRAARSSDSGSSAMRRPRSASAFWSRAPACHIVDVEVSGATTAAVSFAREPTATLVGSDIHDNPGAALAIRAGARPRITHNVFSRNGTVTEHARDVHRRTGCGAGVLSRTSFSACVPTCSRRWTRRPDCNLEHDNWFPGRPPPAAPAPAQQP